MVRIIEYPEGWYVVCPMGEPLTNAMSREKARKEADKMNERLAGPETDSDVYYTAGELADDWNSYDAPDYVY